ncbi:unnamed protein product [Lymnaea stagnalis]|uniref:Kinase n=1 Tax=Lymnaea stagnalis TaxID=6523 RepID=A0AAV2IL79_LYMST
MVGLLILTSHCQQPHHLRNHKSQPWARTHPACAQRDAPMRFLPGSLHPYQETNPVVENHLRYLRLLISDTMGCRHSRTEETEEDSVESIRYSRRSTKIKRSKRKKLSKKAGHALRATSNGVDGDDAEAETHEAVTQTASKAKDLYTKSKKKNNERVQMFGNQSIKNVLTLSVDTPEAAEMEAKQGKFGSKHVFPIWESHYNEMCKCVNVDINDASPVPQEDNRKPSMSSDRLCKRCSQLLLNNKRGVANNNNSNGSGSTESNGGVDGASSVNTNSNPAGGGVGAPGDPNLLSNDPFQILAQQTQIAAIANLLVLAALDLSVPASSLLVKNRKNAWIQLAGHPGSFAPAGPNTIWKKRLVKENYETLAYQALSDFPQSRNIMPAFYREVEFNGEYFIEMEDLLHHFNDPSIMDIKMGTRTFLEAEVKNPVLRKDLYEKMVKVEPDAPTPEERAQEAITKLRYMQFREQESSTASLGFRIEAIRMTGEPPNTNLKKVRTKEEVKTATNVSYFIETFVQGHEVVIPTLFERLCDIREKFESIPFFNTHEIIGSSLLIMYDRSNHAGAWMIDFAKTIPVDDVTLNHRSPWRLGNHEDGYLIGLDNLVEIFGGLVEKQKASRSEGASKSSS